MNRIYASEVGQNVVRFNWMIYLETLRLKLESINDQNQWFLAQCLADPAVMIPAAGMVLDPIQIQAAIDGMRRHWDAHGFGHCIGVLKETNQPVGVFGLKHLPVEDRSIIDLGILVVPSFQKQGLAIEAGRALVEHGFRVHGFEEIGVAPSKSNIRAIELARANGFEFVRAVTRKSDVGIDFENETLWVLKSPK